MMTTAYFVVIKATGRKTEEGFLSGKLEVYTSKEQLKSRKPEVTLKVDSIHFDEKSCVQCDFEYGGVRFWATKQMETLCISARDSLSVIISTIKKES